jgi:hypothetical protein
MLQLLYQDWLLLPPQLMSVKEAVLLLQRLAYLQDRFDADPATCSKWHNLFLDIVYGICTSDKQVMIGGVELPLAGCLSLPVLTHPAVKYI